jgi:hypothetical protein
MLSNHPQSLVGKVSFWRVLQTGRARRKIGSK